MSTTQKQEEFQKMTLKDDQRLFRPLSVVPGLGQVSITKLEEIGFANVGHLVGQFLLFSCDTDLMEGWLKEKLPSTVQERHRKVCAEALKSWCDQNL